MKKSSIHWKDIAIFVLLLSMVGLYLWNLIIKQRIKVSDEIINTVKNEEIPPVISIKKPGGGNILSQNVIKKKEDFISKNEYNKVLAEGFIKDTVIAALKKAENLQSVEVKSLVKLVGEAKGLLTAKDLVIDSLEKTHNPNLLQWRNKYMWASADFDKKSLDYKYNIEVYNMQVTEVGKGFLGTKLFAKKIDKMISTSRDPNATFSEMVQMQTVIKPRKDVFNLSAEVGGTYFLKPYNQLAVYVGIRGTINPDGKFQPSVSGQYYYNPFTQKVMPVVDVKLSYTIFE